MRDLVSRFLAKCQPDPRSECVLWTGAVTDRGYGVMRVDPRYGLPLPVTARVHRLAYHLVRGPIEAGLVLDHTCHVRLCVNPYHLQPVTVSDNSIEANAYRWHGEVLGDEQYWEDLEDGF